MNDLSISNKKTLRNVQILIPAYNEENFLNDTLRSVQNQIFKNFTVVILNDHSLDKTAKISNEFARVDPRFKVVNNKMRLGLIGNFRKSLSYLNSEYFMWLGAHDFISPNYISELINSLESNKTASMAHGCINYVTGLKISKNCEPDFAFGGEDGVLNYLKSIGMGRQGTTNFHGIYRTSVILPVVKHAWGSANYDHVLLSRAAFFGTVFNSQAGYFRRIWDSDQIFQRKTLGNQERYYAINTPTKKVNDTFIPLIKDYIWDWVSLPLSLWRKIHTLPKLIYLIKLRFEINFISSSYFFLKNLLQTLMLKKL